MWKIQSSSFSRSTHITFPRYHRCVFCDCHPLTHVNMLFKCAIIVFVTALWADKAYAQTCDEPCAQVSAQWAAQRAANATARVVVDGQLAYDCLTSVPLNEENAVRLVRSIQPFLDWQSSELEPGPGHFSTDELT